MERLVGIKYYRIPIFLSQLDISKPNIVYDFRNNQTNNHLFPDGMTIDTEGNIYVATFNGHRVY